MRHRGCFCDKSFSLPKEEVLLQRGEKVTLKMITEEDARLATSEKILSCLSALLKDGTKQNTKKQTLKNSNCKIKYLGGLLGR